MKKFIKPLAVILIIACISLQTSMFCFATGSVKAAISVSSSSVTIGDTVRVTVSYSGSDIGSYSFKLNYDSTILTYVSGADSGGNGTLNFANSYDSGQSRISVVVTFKSNATGTVRVSTSSGKFYDFTNVTSMGVTEAGTTITINSATTAPAAPTTTKKSSTTTTTKKATTTKPANGATTAASTEATTLANTDYATVNGVSYIVVNDSATVTSVPAGFTESYSDYNGKEILTYTSKDSSTKLACLLNETNQQFFAVFDDEANTFSNLIQVSSTNIPLIIITAPDSIIPDEFTRSEIIIGDKTVTVYENAYAKENGYYLVYALNSEGVAGFYLYDQTQGTFQRYFVSNIAPTTEESTTVETLETKIPLSKVNLLKIMCAMAAVLLASGIAIVTLAVKLKKSKVDVEEEDYFYNTMTK